MLPNEKRNKVYTLKDVRGLPIIDEYDLYDSELKKCGWSMGPIGYILDMCNMKTTHFKRYDYKGDVIVKKYKIDKY